MKIISSGTASLVFKALKQIWIPFVFCLMTVALSRNAIWFFELSKNSSCRFFSRFWYIGSPCSQITAFYYFNSGWNSENLFWVMRVLKIALQGIWTKFMFLPYARQDKSNISSSLKKKKKNNSKYGKSSFRSKMIEDFLLTEWFPSGTPFFNDSKVDYLSWKTCPLFF